MPDPELGAVGFDRGGLFQDWRIHLSQLTNGANNQRLFPQRTLWLVGPRDWRSFPRHVPTLELQWHRKLVIGLCTYLVQRIGYFLVNVKPKLPKNKLTRTLIWCGIRCEHRTCPMSSFKSTMTSYVTIVVIWCCIYGAHRTQWWSTEDLIVILYKPTCLVPHWTCWLFDKQ